MNYNLMLTIETLCRLDTLVWCLANKAEGNLC